MPVPPVGPSLIFIRHGPPVRVPRPARMELLPAVTVYPREPGTAGLNGGGRHVLHESLHLEIVFSRGAAPRRGPALPRRDLCGGERRLHGGGPGRRDAA